MTEIIAIREIRKGSWAVHYMHTCSCGCTSERGIEIMVQEEKPTIEQATTKINETHD
jgi:hypothetical protein